MYIAQRTRGDNLHLKTDRLRRELGVCHRQQRPISIAVRKLCQKRGLLWDDDEAVAAGYSHVLSNLKVSFSLADAGVRPNASNRYSPAIRERSINRRHVYSKQTGTHLVAAHRRPAASPAPGFYNAITPSEIPMQIKLVGIACVLRIAK